ncbi:hypothetical protein BC835DRAFT_1323099 [Cytidiella melzeri]|nr:hypothetical protein BC835DRAFT_1323099 [Cytidiella melzeri]
MNLAQVAPLGPNRPSTLCFSPRRSSTSTMCPCIRNTTPSRVCHPLHSCTRYSAHQSYSGSYIINPELPGSPLAHTAFYGSVRRHGRHRCMKSNVTPNATFHTRHGQISLNLATAGGTNVPNKTYVQMSSRHGRINVNMVRAGCFSTLHTDRMLTSAQFALQPDKHICLEIMTRHGK